MQLLSYLCLARLQNSAEFARVGLDGRPSLALLDDLHRRKHEDCHACIRCSCGRSVQLISRRPAWSIPAASTGRLIPLSPVVGAWPLQVSFEEDIIISPPNEYEVLQLLLADCRDRFTAYGGALYLKS